MNDSRRWAGALPVDLLSRKRTLCILCGPKHVSRHQPAHRDVSKPMQVTGRANYCEELCIIGQ